MAGVQVLFGLVLNIAVFAFLHGSAFYVLYLKVPITFLV